MAVRNKLGNGLELVKLNSVDDVFEKNNLYEKCIMCRDEMEENEFTYEHIFPRWLQKKYGLEHQTIILPNNSKMKYSKMLVPCCQICNGGIMSEWENIIKRTVEEGFDEFKKLDSKIIAWWVCKLYYSKLVKESQLRNNIKDPNSDKIIEEVVLKKYNNIYLVMSNLIKGISYKGFNPYELYIFRTSDPIPFDYRDDINTHTVYMKMDDIIMVCSLDSYNIFSSQYEREIQSLINSDNVHQIQAMEIFTKMVYFRYHYGFETSEQYILDEHGCYVQNEIQNLDQIKEFDMKELHDLLIAVWDSAGVDVSQKKYEEGKMITLIK